MPDPRWEALFRSEEMVRWVERETAELESPALAVIDGGAPADQPLGKDKP